jgi:hypothetical protein
MLYLIRCEYEQNRDYMGYETRKGVKVKVGNKKSENGT